MKKSLVFILCMMLILCSCNSKLNPEWYPNGTGKDIVYTFGNGKFLLGKTTDGMDLSMFEEDGSCGVILAFVYEYKVKKDKVYICSDEGYCVIDKNKNTAEVLITVEKQHFLNLVGEDEAVSYLSSYDGFSEKDREVFEIIKK